MGKYDGLEVEVSFEDDFPKVVLKGDNWSGQKVKAVSRMLRQGYNRWRREQLKKYKQKGESEQDA